MATERKIPWQARQVWKRFCGWYGADMLERKFGPSPPEDWCDAIEDIDPKRLDTVLANVRMKHPQWPPGLPEFEQIARTAGRARNEGPATHEALTADVLRAKPPTPNQLRGWTFFGEGELPFAGVLIPSDGDAPGYRVTVADMQGGVA